MLCLKQFVRLGRTSGASTMCVAPLTTFKFVFVFCLCSVFRLTRVFSKMFLRSLFDFVARVSVRLCDEEKRCVRAARFIPMRPPERLGLKVFRARGCRGGKQQ